MNIQERCLENLDNIPVFYEKLVNDRKKIEIEIKQKQTQFDELVIDSQISNEELIKLTNEQNSLKAKINFLNSKLTVRNSEKQLLFEKVCKITQENLSLESKLESKTNILEQKKNEIEKMKEKYQNHENKLNQFFSDFLKTDDQLSNIDQIISALESKKKDLENDTKNSKFSNQPDIVASIKEMKEKISILHCLIDDHKNEINEKRIKNEKLAFQIEKKKTINRACVSKKGMLREEINRRNDKLNKKNELMNKIKILEENLKNL